MNFIKHYLHSFLPTIVPVISAPSTYATSYEHSRQTILKIEPNLCPNIKITFVMMRTTICGRTTLRSSNSRMNEGINVTERLTCNSSKEYNFLVTGWLLVATNFEFVDQFWISTAGGFSYGSGIQLQSGLVQNWCLDNWERRLLHHGGTGTGPAVWVEWWRWCLKFCNQQL